MAKHNQQGSHVVAVVLGIAVLGVIGIVGWRVLGSNKKDVVKSVNDGSSAVAKPESKPSQSNEKVTWSFTDEKWVPSSTPPKCPDPLLTSPADVKTVESILYPGQYRGSNYKAHGGFRFPNTKNSYPVKMAMDTTIVQGSRYIENGTVQYMFDFVNNCGIALRYDHLLTLSDVLQKLANTLPEAKPNNSQTTPFNDGTKFKAGEVIATEIGFKKPTINASFDFGVYDYRKPNSASQNAEYAAARKSGAGNTSMSFYATCWLDVLPKADTSIVKALPGGDGMAGKTSDYCK